VAIDAIQGDESADASQFSMGLQWLWLLSSTPLVLLVAGGWSAFRNGSRRSLNLDRDADIASLIEGVLQQPSAFGHMTVVFNRPLVPRIDGSMTSLSTSRSLAAKGRLYRAEGRTKLAAQAAKSGAVVLDARTAEGRAVADALGAIDLDRWAELLARSFCDATIDRINATLVTEGEDWSLRLVRGTNVSFSVLDLAPLERGSNKRVRYGSCCSAKPTPRWLEFVRWPPPTRARPPY
jgi:hypothetical protein